MASRLQQQPPTLKFINSESFSATRGKAEASVVVGSMELCGPDKALKSTQAGAKRRRRLGVCHHSGTALPAALRLLQDLARPISSNNHPNAALQRRNAFRKNSAPAAKPLVGLGSDGAPVIRRVAEAKGLGSVDELPNPVRRQEQRLSLTAVSRGISIITTPASVLLYVSRGQGPDHCWHFSRGRRRTYPSAPRGVRRHRSGRCSLAAPEPTTSGIDPSARVTKKKRLGRKLFLTFRLKVAKCRAVTGIDYRAHLLLSAFHHGMVMDEKARPQVLCSPH